MKLQEMTTKEMFDYCKRQGDKVYDIVNKEIRNYKKKDSKALDQKTLDKIVGLGKLYKKKYMTAMNIEIQTPHTQSTMENKVRKMIEVRKEIIEILKGEK